MKRTELLKRLARAAKADGIPFGLVREGGSHSIYQYSGIQVSIPRHREIDERTAWGVLRRVGL